MCRPVAVICIFAAALLSACHAAPRAVQVPQAVVSEEAPNRNPLFAVAPSILSGYELAATPDDWQIGDEILLGFRVTKPGADTIRLLHIQLTDLHNPTSIAAFAARPQHRDEYTLESSLLFTRMTLYDEAGGKLDTTIGRFPLKLMGYGLYDGAAPAVGRPRLPDGTFDLRGVSDDQAEREFLGWLSLFSFSTSLGRKGLLQDMLRDVAARPWLVSMLFDSTVALEADGELEHRAWTPAPSASTPGVMVPLACTISGKPAAVGTVWAARPVAPLGLCGGVVAVRGHNAKKPEITFEVHVLAAKRGSGGRSFTTVSEDPQP